MIFGTVERIVFNCNNYAFAINILATSLGSLHTARRSIRPFYVVHFLVIGTTREPTSDVLAKTINHSSKNSLRFRLLSANPRGPHVA